ncbi:MAG: pyridoxal phosphate-dependent aminotransferase [Clostridiales bacterium]|nr:pyridoxal phosphate-dependent aminotransferase [Clostridiales bacterium]
MTGIAQRCKRVSPSLTLEITAKAKQMRAEGKSVVSFGAGEPDFNTPAYIVRAAEHALSEGMTKYTPASGTEQLKKAICDKLQKDNSLTYEPKNIVVSNGAKHALYNAFLAIVDPGDEVIVPAPYWLTYPELIKLCEGVPVFVHAKAENDFKLTADELKAAITPKTKAVLLNNPCNPTGAVYDKAELTALAKVLEEANVYVISDEIYEKLVYEGGAYYSIAQYSEKLKEKTIVINGVSKTYAMTGWRIGYTASNAEIAKAISGMQSHTTSNPNSIAQYASYAAYSHSEGDAFLAEMLATFDGRRKEMIEKLRAMKDLSFIYPKGAFYVMIDVEHLFGKTTAGGAKLTSAYDVATALLAEQMVAAIPCESFGAPQYLRLSYAISNEDIREGLRRLEKFIAGVK